MSETIRGIITDCVAGISILLVLGVAFFIYDLGLQHIYQELHELRAELSSVKQRNQELEMKMRFIEDGVHEETFSRQKDDEFDQPEIPSAEFELSSEVQALNEPDTCTTAVYARDLFDDVCIWDIPQIKRPKTRRKSGVKYKRKLNSKRTSSSSYIIKRKSPRQICKTERQLKQRRFATRGKGFSKSGRKGKATSKPRGKHKATSKPRGKRKATTKPATLVKSTSRSKIYATSKRDKKVKATSRQASKVKASPKQTTQSKPASKTRGTAKSTGSNARTQSKMSAKPVKVNKAAAPKMRNTRTASQSVRKPPAPRRASASHRRRG